MALKRCSLFATVFATLMIAGTSLAEAWPQYRGPRHDGTAAAESIAPWSNNGPEVVWKTATSGGFSSFSVAEGRAYTLVARTLDGVEREVCIALDAETGRELWAAPLGIARYDGGGDSGTRDNRGGDGPRSTPSVHDARVYVLDARLGLYCLDARTGEVKWSVDLVKEYGAKAISWQSAASPLVVDGRVFVMGGGRGQALLAFHADTGQAVWKAHHDAMTHATPIPATIHGVKQIIFFTQSGLVAVEPATGKALWRQEYPYRTSTAASPVVYEDVVYCSAGYGVGAAAYRIEQTSRGLAARELWRTPNKLMSHWSTPVVKDGYLYGLFGFKQYGDAPLMCIDIRTGQEKWSKEGFGPGNVILAGDRLIVLSDKGEIVLIEASPQAYRELARADVLRGKCWSSPALSEGTLYVRSSEQGAALRIAPPTQARR